MLRLSSTYASIKLKGIGGTSHKRWIMLFNSLIRDEPYQALTYLAMHQKWLRRLSGIQVVHGCRQLVSWDVRLSPATSATLIAICHHSVGHYSETASDKLEEGGNDVKSSCPLWPGLQTWYNGCHKRMLESDFRQIQKYNLSSDWSLQLDFMKSESLVIVDQNATVNTFSRFAHTARQTTKVNNTQNRWPNCKEGAV